METAIPQVLLFLFLVGIVLVAYEMKAALRAPFCSECPHCRTVRELEQRGQTELDDWYRQRYGVRRRDDDERGR